MKPLRTIFILSFISVILLTTCSCVVLVKEPAPRHQGWYKNSNNPHHLRSTNPGISKGDASEKKQSKRHHED